MKTTKEERQAWHLKNVKDIAACGATREQFDMNYLIDDIEELEARVGKLKEANHIMKDALMFPKRFGCSYCHFNFKAAESAFSQVKKIMGEV